MYCLAALIIFVVTRSISHGQQKYFCPFENCTLATRGFSRPCNLNNHIAHKHEPRKHFCPFADCILATNGFSHAYILKKHTGTRSLLGAAGQKILPAGFWEYQDCINYIAATSCCCMLAAPSYATRAGMQSYD